MNSMKSIVFRPEYFPLVVGFSLDDNSFLSLQQAAHQDMQYRTPSSEDEWCSVAVENFKRKPLKFRSLDSRTGVIDALEEILSNRPLSDYLIEHNQGVIKRLIEKMKKLNKTQVEFLFSQVPDSDGKISVNINTN